MGLTKVLNIEDLRRLAEQRVPRVVFDYIDGGADAEITLHQNSRVFDTVTFRPRGAVSVPSCDLRAKVLGNDLAVPFILAPVGSSRMFSPRGEEAAARAAGKVGTIYSLSTLSGCPMEDVKRASSGPLWYQLYLCGGRDVATAGIERARKAGFSALIVTIDTAVAGMRERDFRNGIKQLLGKNLFAKAMYSGQFLARPRWLMGLIGDGGMMKFPNVMLPDGPMPYADVGTALEKSVVTWDDLRWIRETWQGPIIIKGVQAAEDGRRAVDHGAAAVVVSNHGGRQLDSVPSTLEILPEVVSAVNGQAEVLLDSGIRRGSDIVKALCLGARAVLIGRAYAYGLAAGGEAGVSKALEILRKDMVRTLKLLGCASLNELNASYLNLPSTWPDRHLQS